MHIYQKHILDQLRESSSLRYSQMQPNDVESSHFKYHLNQLLKDGSVEQVSRGVYALSAAGKASVDRMSRGKVNPDMTPKVITYTLLKDSDNYYLQCKEKEPYLGLLNMIGGKVHLGETTEDASKREVFEKTGQQVTENSLQGIAEIRINQGSLLLSHVIAYVYMSELADTVSLQDLTKIPISDLASHDMLAPDLLSIINALKSTNDTFAITINAEY